MFVYYIYRLSKKKKYTTCVRFHGNGPYCKVLTKKEPIRTLRFTLCLPRYVINICIGLKKIDKKTCSVKRKALCPRMQEMNLISAKLNFFQEKYTQDQVKDIEKGTPKIV